MSAINPIISTQQIPVYNPYASQPVINAQPQNNISIAPDIVQKGTAEAAKAYITPFVAPKKVVIDVKSLPEYKDYLIKQGKVEGKDFEIDQDEMMSSIRILENGKPVSILRYNKKGESKEDFESVENISYPISNNASGIVLKSMNTVTGADGEFHFRTTYYEKGKSPYENDIVNYGTRPEVLIEHLKAKGVRYASDYTLEAGNLVRKITAFDNNNIIRYEIKGDSQGNAGQVTKCILDNNGNIAGEVCYDEFSTSYTEFVDSFRA